MSSRWRRYLTEAGRFLAVGGLATLVALVLFNLLLHGFGSGRVALLESQPILAYVLANTVGMVVSFHGSRNYAFKDRSVRPADGGISAFVVINAVTMLLPIACLTISREALGLTDPVSDNVSANVIGLVLGMAARFFLFRTFVFRRPLPLPGEERAAVSAPAGSTAGSPVGAPVSAAGSSTGAPTSAPAGRAAPEAQAG
ncbi:GtrA family protein [Nocardioides sp. zg-DK7169]|uniref:GtrA family protein n=1 Tax=Nocardioides sp. zg-DK7169 TaxID=2736600 RepID=UPI0015574FDD|nr:GtrA family protein [Nocardioides sp. zg-DK7169]NPC95704.1 GtrA family protein [Nocardioides sp. zg-DK7169]